MVGGTGGKYGWGREVFHRATFFYADDGLIASTEPVWLQGELKTLTVFFDRVGLQKTSGNTVDMLCRPCRSAGNQ